MSGNTRGATAPRSRRAAASRRRALWTLSAAIGAVLLPLRADRLAARSDPTPLPPGAITEADTVPYFSTYPPTVTLPPDPRLMARAPKLRDEVAAVTDRTIPGPGGILPLRLYPLPVLALCS